MLIKKVSSEPSPPRSSQYPWGAPARTMTTDHTFSSQAVLVRKHLERNRKDKDAKFRLILIESRIHRLARYYKTVGVLPPTWKYESATASTLVA